MRCRLISCAMICCLLAAGCLRSTGQNEVTVYTALDSEFSEPILHDFSQSSGIRALPKFDVESTKTVGLAQAIMAEHDRPRCDVFWNNEILHTIRLDEAGLLEAYPTPVGESFPAMFRSPRNTWYGFAARARVLLVNTKLVQPADAPQSIEDLCDQRWKGQIAIAKPLFGTTATHVACLFAVLGPEKAKDYFRRLKANGVQILSGNKQVAQAVAGGQAAFGLTDTDDAIIEVEQGRQVGIIYPDRKPSQMGTLFIPNTVAIIKNCPHPESARRLVDYLLTPATERRLAESASAQIPLNPEVDVQPKVETPRTVHAMQVDFAAAAHAWDAAAKFIRDEFAGE